MTNLVILNETELNDLLEKAVEKALAKLQPPTTAETKPKYITRDEACSMLKISKVTLWKLTKANLINCYRIGGRVLYSESEIQQAIRQANFKPKRLPYAK